MKPVTLLINQVLNTAQFPDKLKVAKVIPIFKKNYPTLRLLFQVLERIMNNQLFMHFTNTKLLCDNQYGFRPHHSTEYADLSKTFYTLDHTILLKKLEHYGLESSALQLLKSYLTNREQFVKN